MKLPLRDDVDARVAELLRNIAEACGRLSGEDYNQANKRLAEEFLAQVERDFPGRCPLAIFFRFFVSIGT